MAITTYVDFVNNYLVKNGMIGNATNINKAPDQLKLELDEINLDNSAANILVKLKTVDGAGSGLDADLLDGMNATNANTATTVVSRDASGNFSAGIITAALSGNAATATKLQTARTINGVNFDGSANITVVDSTAVKLTGNQTIGDVKTFTSSPIVPIATTDFQTTPARSTNITVTVGSGGQYPTINAALEYLSGFYPLYKKSGVTATINLKAGFVMAEQVLVSGIDLGWITIVGEDAETIITHTALTTAFNGGYPAFGVDKGGTLPIIGQLFNMNLGVSGASSNKHGVMAFGAGSSANILSGKGVKNAGTYGIFATAGSTINANSANASSAGTYGIVASDSSTINAYGANASSAGTHGIYALHGSTINANSANASSAGTHGIVATGGSTIDAYSANASSAGYHGIVADNGSTINASYANASGAGAYGIVAAAGSTINANSANASSAGSHGIVADNGSSINANSANASGAGTFGIVADIGSSINASYAVVQNQSSAGARIRVYDGSTIEASNINTTGGTSPVFSQTVNTLTSNGIIYQ